MTDAGQVLWNRNYIKIMVVNFAMYFVFYLLMPLLPLYLSDHFHASNDVIGVVLSGFTLVALFSRPITGYLIDSFSRKWVLIICFLFYSLFFASYLLAGSLLAFALFRTLHGGPFGASTVANNTVAIDVLPSARRNEGIGLYGLSNNLATAVAPSVGIYLYTLMGPDSFVFLFWLAFGVAVIGFIVAATIHMENRQPLPNSRQLSLDRFFLSRGWLVAANLVFFGFCYGVLANYLAIYGREQLGITNGTGTFFMFLSIGLILSRLMGGKQLAKGNITDSCSQGTALASLGYLFFVAWPAVALFFGSSHTWLLVGYLLSAFLIGLGNGHMYPGFLNMMVGIARHNQRGTATSTVLTAWDGGLGLGILFGGVISEHLGYVAAFWLVALVHFGGWILFLLFTRRFYLQRKLAVQ